MKLRVISIAALVVGATAAPAQNVTGGWTPELRPFVGVFMPTGALRNDLKSATTLGAQGALEISSRFHLVGTAAWTHGHEKFGLSTDRVDLWQYDVGVEGNVIHNLSQSWMLRPFAGLGAGGRTLDFKAEGLGSKTCTAGYGALGTELQRGAVALRLEGRNYLSCYESPITNVKKTRNDATVAFGLAFHLR